MPDDGAPQPDTEPEGFEVVADIGGDQQRGPVVARLISEHEDLSGAVVTGEWRRGPGDPWKDATPLGGYSEEWKFVWDSMADVQEDVSAVDLHLVVVREDGGVHQVFVGPFALYNDPARARQVLITHDINGDDRVRQLTWTHGVGLGGGEGTVHTVGASPRRVTFSPNGALAAVVEEGSEHIRVLRFDLETGALSGQSTIPAPGLYPVDAAFSGDGAELYVVHSSPDPDGGVYRVPITPVGGEPLGGAALTQIHAQWQAGDLDVLPGGRGLAVVGPDPTGNLEGIVVVVLDRDGDLLGEAAVGPEGCSPRNVAASPDGQWLLASYFNFFGAGDRLLLLSLDDGGVPALVTELAVSDPEGMAWTGDSLAGLVTEVMGADDVTGLAFADGTVVEGTSIGLGLPERVAHTTWGPDRDTFLVTTVSSGTGESGLGVVTVEEGGAVTNTGVYVLGSGNDKIPGDVAIQP